MGTATLQALSHRISAVACACHSIGPPPLPSPICLHILPLLDSSSIKIRGVSPGTPQPHPTPPKDGINRRLTSDSVTNPSHHMITESYQGCHPDISADSCVTNITLAAHLRSDAHLDDEATTPLCRYYYAKTDSPYPTWKKQNQANYY